MEKIWLKNYQEGIPFEIDPEKFPSINESFEEACQRFGDLPAFNNFNKTLTYKEIEEKSRQFASYLQNTLILKKGDRIALMMPNLLQYPVAMFGALRAGLIVVNVNPLCKARELEYLLKDSGSETIVIVANFMETLECVLKKRAVKNIIVTEVGDLLSFPHRMLVNWTVKYIKKMVPKYSVVNSISFRKTLEIGKNRVFEKTAVSGEDIAFLQYTGGTTGVSKGAVLTHQNIVSNIEQAYAWIKPQVKEGGEIIITALPLYHIFSLMANCLTFMRVGALNVLITNPRDIKGFIKILNRYAFTSITGVNTLFKALLDHPNFARLDFSHLRISLGGGMAVQHSVALRWKEITGKALLEAYGLTEASPAVCISPLNLKEYNESVGLPISSTDISIRDDDGNPVGYNEPGELWISGPQVMRGYWHKVDETKEVLQDGWLRTGDVATIDEQGFVRVIDRKKDMILVSGFNVYPNEVEDVIAAIEGVAEVAVIGVSFEGEEKVKAFIVKKDVSLTKGAIIEHCRKELSNYKIPKEIEFREELPKTNVGKILRRALKEQR